MVHRRRVGAAVAAMLLVLGGWAAAQSQRWTPLTEPTVLAGPDVGFRVKWMNGQVPYGQLVVRLNGQWVEAQIGGPPNMFIAPSPPPPPALPPAPPPPR